RTISRRRRWRPASSHCDPELRGAGYAPCSSLAHCNAEILTRSRKSPSSPGSYVQPTTHQEIRAVIIGAGARGNQVFAELMRRHDIGWRVSAVVEPDELRRVAFCARHDVPPECAF